MPTPPPEQVVLLANPASGRGYGARAAARAMALLKERGIHPDVRFTERPGHAVELAAAVAEERPELLLVIGGDGTFRDVAQGLGGASLPVGILPGGTGNDLARALGLPRATTDGLEIALGAHERALDVWQWNDAVFVNVAGVGLDAAVAETANRRFRSLRGVPAYLAAFAATLPGFKPFDLALQWPDGAWAGRAWLAAFGSGSCYGGGMQIAPAAQPDDGLLDLIVIEDVSLPQLLWQFPGIFDGRHVRHPRVRSFRVESVRVEAELRPATIDGELIASVPAEVSRLPWTVRVRVPPAPCSGRNESR